MAKLKYTSEEQFVSDEMAKADAANADMASVGYDGNKYAMLVNSGTALSQMSDGERNYIKSHYQYTPSTTYKNNATDQYLASVGLPPSSELSKYRTAYSKYTSGGGIEENYGNLSDAQWERINELWKKDWEYGLTDTDYMRRAAGLAPSSYDDMYEDTLLDDELKARGLPPSKLLNGKLGETYNAWVKDAHTEAALYDDFTRTYIQNSKKTGVAKAVDNVVTAFGGTPSTYTMEQAWADTLAKPEWAEFRDAHAHGSMQELPSPDDEAYVVKDENGYALLDENGQKVYDTAKWEDDVNKINAKNAKITGDEFSINLESAKEYYNENAAMTMADIEAQDWAERTGLKYDYDTRYMNEDYVNMMSDFYYAKNVFNEGNGYTIDLLFPDVELTDEERAELQPLVDTLNTTLYEEGYTASQEYLESGEFSTALHNIYNDKIVAHYRNLADSVSDTGYTSKYADMTDEEILHEHYKMLGETYMMSAEDVARLESGEISVASYMSEHYKTPEEAMQFAREKLTNELETTFGISSKDDIDKRLETRHKAEELASALMVNLGADYAEYGDLLTMSDEDYNRFWENRFATIAETDTEDGHYRREEERKKQEADDARRQVLAVDSTIHKYGYSYETLKRFSDRWDAAELNNYVDAVSYTADFAQKTSDMDYVNERFEQICEKYNNAGGDISDLYALATNDEKRKLVYLADTEGTTYSDRRRFGYDAIGGGFTFDYVTEETLAGRADMYLNKVLLHEWDMEKREYNRSAQGGAEGRQWWGEDSDSGFVRWLGGLGSWTAAIAAGIGEGVFNFAVDTSIMAGEYELLSSRRSTWGQDVIGNIAGHVQESHPGLGGEIGSFAVQAIPSMIQSGVSMWLAAQTGGATEAITLALMSAQAYSGAVDSALQQGASSQEAYVFGLLNGANEFIFEKISLDSLLSVLDVSNLSGKALAATILKNMGTQGFVEGMEEVNTSIANLLAESLVLGYNSSFNKTVERYVAAGLTEEQAKELARKEIENGVVMDFVGGLVSGAIMAGGGNLINAKTSRNIILDRTGLTEFMQTTHNLSTISVNDALAYAKEHLVLDANGKYTIDSARNVFTELVNRGADSAVLSRVNVELLNKTNTTQGVNAVVTNIIDNQRTADGKKLLKSASKYVYSDENKRRKVKSSVPMSEVDTVVKTYLNELSNTVQTRDLREIEKAANDMRNSFIEEMRSLAGFEKIRIGTYTLDGYFKSLDAQAQATITQNAAKYKNTFNQQFKGKGDVAARYANMAAAIEYAVGQGNALTGLNTVFGDSATVASTAVENICLNSDGKTATRFINGVLESIATLQQQSDSHLFKTAQNGVDTVSYVATQMALAQSMQADSLSRSMYDYIIKYGATSEALDLLTAANISDTMGETEKRIRKSTATFHTAYELSDITDRYNKAAQNYNDKLKIADAHKQADAQALASENARIAGQEETVRVLEAQFQETQGSDKGVVDALAKARNALNTYVTARDNLVAEQNKRMASTQADVDSAREAYSKARAFYQMTLKEQAVRYIEHFGSQLEGIRNRDHVSHIELARMNTYAMYAAAENLNQIEERMIANEKTSAVALGAALGVEVECVSFTEEFFDSKKVPKANRNKAAKGVRIGGKVYLNTDVMTANVGSLTNEVLLHEIGHILEVNADNYEKYSAFAVRYFEERDGKETVNKWIKSLMENEEHPMTEDDAYAELVAEFTRQVALADPRAVAALCKSAPKMSMRVFQWLTNTRNRMDTVAASQTKIVRDAQRAFAKGMKAIRETNALKTAQDQYDNTPSKAAMDNAVMAMAERARLEAERQRTAQAQANTQQAETQAAQTPQTVEQQTQTEQTESVEPEQTVAETAETPVEEQVAESAEEPAVEKQTVDVVEEQEAEETPAKEEPTEDFADVVVEEETANVDSEPGVDETADLTEDLVEQSAETSEQTKPTFAQGEQQTQQTAETEQATPAQQQTQEQPAAEEHAPASRASEYDRVETEPVPYDDWGEMIDENIYEDIDGDQTMVGYIMDEKRYVSEQYHEPITKKRILQMVDDWRMDDGTYGDADVTIYIAYDDGKIVDLKDLVSTDKEGNVIGKPYKKSGIIGVYVGTADDEASWGYEINRNNGERVPMSVSIQNENDEPEQLDGNWYVGWKTTGEYYVREKVTSNNIDERGRAHTKREILRRSTVHPYDGAEPFAEEKAEKKAERKAAKSPVQADRVETPTLTQPVDDTSAPAEAESPVEQPTTTEQPQNQNPRFGLSAAGNAVIDAFVKSRNTSFPKKRTFSQKTAQKTANNVLKAAKKSNVKAIQYGYTDWSERQTVTDSHRVYRFGEHNERLDLPRLPDGVEYPNINKLFDQYKSGKTIELTAPDYQTIKALAKERGAYSFGEGLPTVQARYLAELMDTYPDVKIYALDDANKAIRPIYAVSRKGEALIVPMRVNADNYDSQISEEVKTLARDYINANGRAIDSEELDAFINQYVTPTAIMKGATSFLGAPNSAQYYTEYDPQTVAVRDNIEKMTDFEKKRTGDPRLIRTSNGYMVSRKMSKEGFALGNPMYNTNKRNIAMIAPVSEFPNGDVGKTVAAGQCKAVVIPNTRQYAEMRADARDAGTLVYNYDESDPTQFDRAINRAANSANVEYMPEMRYEDFLSRYGEIRHGANPRVENRPVPRQTTDTNRVSQMARTAAEAPMTTDKTYSDMSNSWIVNGTGTYTPVSNARTLARARGVLERAGSVTQAAEDLHRDVANSNGKNTDLLARAELLYAEAQNPYSGLTDLQREQIFGDMCIIASDSGRALQLASQLKHMTAEGHIEYIEQVGKRMADRYEKRTKKRKKLTLTQEEIDAYKGAMSEEERNEIDKKVAKRFSDETSDLTFLDRVRNWRYFSMLGNPRTHFRNMVGNALMNPISRTKDTINAGYQRLFGIEQADRTTAAWTGRVSDDVKAFVEEQLQASLPTMQGVSSKYIETATNSDDKSDKGLRSLWQDVASAAITKGRTKFGRALNRLSSFNTNALEYEDAKALGWRFRSAMYQIIKARGLDVNTMTETQKNDIVNYAMEESLRATFRDASALADALNKIANTNRLTRLAMEAIVPFKKTPINIAKRSVEYSPLGVINGVYKMVSNNVQYNQEVARINADETLSDSERRSQLEDAQRTFKTQKIQAIDRLAAGTTGSILTAIGVFAASMGWVSIGRKDDESSQFETSLGKSNYSLNIGDVSIDLSAFSPAAVPLLMGTAMYQAFGAEHDENFVSGMIETLCESVDPITEMSMLSGIADALSGSSYSNYSDGKNTRWFGTIAGNALESYVGQFVPTLVGQTARAFDQYARSYSAGDDYWASKVFGSEVGGAVKNLQNKVGLGWLSEPKVDLHGDSVSNYTNFGSWALNAANNWVLPATIKVDRKNEIDDELVRLYGVVDSSDIFPTKPSRNIGTYTDQKTGEKVTLKLDNDKEYMEYQREVGQTTYDMLEDLMQSIEYQRMTDEQKAEAVSKVIEQAKSATKKRWKAQMIADRK